jgi:hypothetical protein
MSGFDQRDLIRKTATNEHTIPLDGRPLAEAFQAPEAASQERAIYMADHAKRLLQDASFCDAITLALTQHGTSSESVALMRIADQGSAGLLALHALINDPSAIEPRLLERGFYHRGVETTASDARQEAVATKLTHLVFHLESTSRVLTAEDSKVAADILLDVSQNSTFDRAKRHALRVLPTVMRRQGRDYEDPVAHERSRSGGLMG